MESRGREKVKNDLLLAASEFQLITRLHGERYNVIGCSHRQSRRRARLEMGAVGTETIGNFSSLEAYYDQSETAWDHKCQRLGSAGRERRVKKPMLRGQRNMWRVGGERECSCLVVCYHHEQGSPNIRGPLGSKRFKSILLIQQIMCVCSHKDISQWNSSLYHSAKIPTFVVRLEKSIYTNARGESTNSGITLLRLRII